MVDSTLALKYLYDLYRDYKQGIFKTLAAAVTMLMLVRGEDNRS